MKTAKMKEFLGKTLLVVTFILLSCNEDISPCYPMEEQCKNLFINMNEATDPQVKEQYMQKYLSEKHLLENCLNGL